MDSNMEKRSRQLAREEVMQKLRAKRQFMYNSIGSYNWGNPFYPDITKEADSMEDQVDGLGNLLYDLDDDWSGIVKMVFLMLDCYHGTPRYLSSRRTVPPDTLQINLISVERNKLRGRVLISDFDRTASLYCSSNSVFMVYGPPDRGPYNCVAIRP